MGAMIAKIIFTFGPPIITWYAGRDEAKIKQDELKLYMKMGAVGLLGLIVITLILKLF